MRALTLRGVPFRHWALSLMAVDRGNTLWFVDLCGGFFKLCPPVPRYTTTWDVQPVLHQLRFMYPLQELSLQGLALILVVLMSLTLAARVRTFHLLSICGMDVNTEYISLQLGGNVKQCRPSFNVNRVRFQAYSQDERLCVCKTLLEYIDRTKVLRRVDRHVDDKLLISFHEPHRAVSKDTIARWVKSVLCLSGIATAVFKAGSVRPAAASYARAMAVPVSCILQKAGWSREATFAKFYDRPIVSASDLFQDAVLS